MAEFELSRISILEDHLSYTKGDLIVCTYDDSTLDIVVRLNGSIITSGEALTEGSEDLIGSSWWARLDRGFTTTETEAGKSYNVTFPLTASFPYHTKNRTEFIPDVEPDIRDISIRFVSMIMPTSKTALDGEITIEANGTNTPFKYYKTDPRDFTEDSSLASGQDTGEFTGLSAGTYTLYAAGYGANNPRLDSISITITLPVNEVPDISTYGARWEIEYDNFDNETYRTEILERGYTLPVSVVKGAGSPYSHTMRGEGNDFYQLSILSSNATVNLLTESVDEFIDIARADEKKYVLRKSKFNGVTYDTQWTGYITPSTYQDVLFHPPYSVNISSNDRLGDLKGLKFLFGDNDSGNFVKGNVSQLSIIHICLQKLFMGFGYRIACNIFAENHIIEDHTPLDQTLVNVDTYLNDDGTDVAFCDEVIKDILEVYGATLFSWEGYWYIVRQEEWLNETINYVEYNNDIEFVSNGSWNPRIEFKQAQEDNRAVWTGGAQSRIFTPLYRKVNMNLNLNVLDLEGNLLPTLSPDNIEGFDPNDVSNPKFKGFDLINNGSNIDTKHVNNGNGWEIALKYEKGSKSYVETTGNISYSELDQINLSLGVNVSSYGDPRFVIPEYPPYGQLKWSLKLGDEWINRDGNRSVNEIINTEFVDSFGSNVSLDVLLNMTQNSADNGDYYILRVYPVDLEEHDVFAEGISYDPLIAQIKNIPTSNKSVGSRVVAMLDIVTFGELIGRRLFFYELIFGSSGSDSIERINPSHQESSVVSATSWVLRSTNDLLIPGEEVFPVDDDNFYTVPDSGATTVTVFNDIKLEYKRNSENQFNEDFVISSTGESRNNRDLNYDLEQFDIPDVPNAQKIIRNFLKYEDTTPTSNWTKTGGTVTKDIQQHLLDWLTRLSKRCRGKVSGSWRMDGLDCNPINVLIDSSDNNRLYLPIGMSSDFKVQQYSGELLEIGSGDDLSTSAYTIGFKQDAVR